MLRRRPITRWTHEELAAAVSVTYRSVPEGSEAWSDVAAKLIFHQDPDRLPRRAVWKVGDAGGFRPFLLLEFRADRFNLHAWVAGVVQDMWEGAEGFPTHEEALVALEGRVDESWTRCSFADLPPMLQAALYHWASGGDG